MTLSPPHSPYTQHIHPCAQMCTLLRAHTLQTLTTKHPPRPIPPLCLWTTLSLNIISYKESL